MLLYRAVSLRMNTSTGIAWLAHHATRNAGAGSFIPIGPTASPTAAPVDSHFHIVLFPLNRRRTDAPPQVPPSRKTRTRLPQLFPHKGDVPTSPPAFLMKDVNSSPPTFPAQGRRAYVSPSFSCSTETSNTAPPARHSANSGAFFLISTSWSCRGSSWS